MVLLQIFPSTCQTKSYTIVSVGNGLAALFPGQFVLYYTCQMTSYFLVHLNGSKC